MAKPRFRKEDHPGWERFVTRPEDIIVHRPDGKGGYRRVPTEELSVPVNAKRLEAVREAASRRALRVAAAQSRAAWESSINGPILAAQKGNTGRLIDYVLGVHLSAGECDLLAAFVRRPRGAPRKGEPGVREIVREALLAGNVSEEEAERLAALVAETKLRGRPRKPANKLARQALAAYQSITRLAASEGRYRDDKVWMMRWAKDRETRLLRAREWSLRQTGQALTPEGIHELDNRLRAFLNKSRKRRGD